MAREVRICINAGHAERAEPGFFEDPGAIGPSGLTEAAVVTRVTHALVPLLNRLSPEIRAYAKRQPGAGREGLRELVRRINASRPTLLISLHCNGSTNHYAHGPLTIYRRHGAMPCVGGIARSKRLARVILERLPGHTRWSRVVRCPYWVMREGKRRRWDLAVLRSTRVTSAKCLVELGFITHAPTETLMTTRGWVDEIAEALTDGVAAYLGLER